LLAVDDLAVDYGGYVALSGVSLEVRAGEVVCLMRQRLGQELAAQRRVGPRAPGRG
jgi:ABC-type uncharacterized transport system ATPase subunit